MKLAPVIYLPHGGGPMPLLHDTAHTELIRFLQNLSAQIQSVDAIVMISAHWEETKVTVNATAKPGMLFDYYGFPPEAYRFEYRAPGQADLSEEILALFASQGVSATSNPGRGYDHGVFVPMLLLNPAANIPCVQISLIKGLDAAAHIALGLCLKELRKQNVAIIGSGMSFHNLQALFQAPSAARRQASDAFADWLNDSMTNQDVLPEARMKLLSHWHNAPAATFCHPRAEHLLPLHVCLGAAAGEPAELICDMELMGHRVVGYQWR